MFPVTCSFTPPPPADLTRAEAFYTVDGGGAVSLTVTNAEEADSEAGAVISGVPRQDVSGVRNGTPVTGGRRYDITLRVHSETNQMDTGFTIWNIGTPGLPGSGMSVSSDNPADTVYTGVFGYAGGAEIRDLRVDYAAAVTAGAGATHIGGLAGYAGGGTKIRNCLSTGPLSISGSSKDLSIGGIAGSLEGSSAIQNSYGGLNLTVAVGNQVNAGGLAGSVTETASIEASAVRGNMDITGGLTHIGGAAGYITGTDASNLMRITDCIYEAGNIKGEDKSTDDELYLGGITGYVEKFAEFEDCYSRAGSIEGTVDSASFNKHVYYGGFAGYLTGANISRCGSSSPMTLTGTARGTVRIGGLVGQLENDPALGVTSMGLEDCWAVGDINVDDAGGALAGGAVYARRNSIYMIDAGGLVGALGDYTYLSTPDSRGTPAIQNSSIDNCYALGNVLADKTFTKADSGNSERAYAVHAGGLVGYVRINSGNTIKNSFAAGSVTAQSADTLADYKNVYADGIVGRIHTGGGVGGTVSNTAALGASVTAKGDASRIAARVYAYPTSGGGSANYALDAMRVESSAYDSINPPASSPSSTGSSTQHGATANGSTFRDPVFWTSPSYLNFGSTAWNFSTVASRGYPTLANVEVP